MKRFTSLSFLALVGLLAAAPAARGQGCNQKCKAEQKDAKGCCPAPPAKAATPATAQKPAASAPASAAKPSAKPSGKKPPARSGKSTPAPAPALLITADVPVSLTLDGQSAGHLDAEQSQRFVLAAGEHQVLAVSDVEQVEYRATAMVNRTGDTPVKIVLAPQIQAKNHPAPAPDDEYEEPAPPRAAQSGPQVKPGDFVMVAELDSEPRQLEKSELVVPEAARARRHQGVIIVLANIDERGTVTEATLMRGIDDDMGINQAAVDAAKKSRFTPGIKNGVPVKTAKSLTYKIVSQ